MTTVPGSMPKMILEEVCKEQRIFDQNTEPEQIFQNLYQLPAGTHTFCMD